VGAPAPAQTNPTAGDSAATDRAQSGLSAADPAEAAAQAMPPYRPEVQVTGTLRLWGHGSTKTDFMRRLVNRWEAGFARFQPGVSFDYRMYGTASAIGALYAGAGDLALMGEEIFPFEEAAYERAMHRPPRSIEIATGSLDVRNFDFAQMFFVHRDNPLSGLTLTQLDAAFGTEHRRGAPRNARTWGDLGLTGRWADRPIHLYGWSLDNDFWIYLGAALLGGSHRVNCDLHEYAHIYRADGTIYDAGQQILEALARDPDGLALSNIRYPNPAVKALALAGEDGIYRPATRATLIDRSYPLTRIIPAVFNGVPGEPMDPKLREFLRYLLSREGQEDIAQDGEYLPLNPEAAARERGKLQ
jgi:phosphate transport system substrate-binding protein